MTSVFSLKSLEVLTSMQYDRNVNRWTYEYALYPVPYGIITNVPIFCSGVEDIIRYFRSGSRRVELGMQ